MTFPFMCRARCPSPLYQRRIHAEPVQGGDVRTCSDGKKLLMPVGISETGRASLLLSRVEDRFLRLLQVFI